MNKPGLETETSRSKKFLLRLLIILGDKNLTSFEVHDCYIAFTIAVVILVLI